MITLHMVIKNTHVQDSLIWHKHPQRPNNTNNSDECTQGKHIWQQNK